MEQCVASGTRRLLDCLPLESLPLEQTTCGARQAEAAAGAAAAAGGPAVAVRQAGVVFHKLGGPKGAAWLQCPPASGRMAAAPAGGSSSASAASSQLPCQLPFDANGTLATDCVQLPDGLEYCQVASGLLAQCLPTALQVGGWYCVAVQHVVWPVLRSGKRLHSFHRQTAHISASSLPCRTGQSFQ